MATPQEIQAALSGFPRALAWTNFRNVQTSPSPPHEAHTSVSWSMGSWSVHIVNGEYRVRNPRVTVTLNGHDSWAMPSAKSSTALLQHEQGHFDITGLIARDLISSVLGLSFDVAVVAALRDSGTTPRDHQRYVTQQFQADINRFAQAATALGARLQTNPVTHADGLYDVQTNHSLNTAVQQAWDARLQRIKNHNENFELALRLEGLI
jgi:hypothetical protein